MITHVSLIVPSYTLEANARDTVMVVHLQCLFKLGQNLHIVIKINYNIYNVFVLILNESKKNSNLS